MSARCRRRARAGTRSRRPRPLRRPTAASRRARRRSASWREGALEKTCDCRSLRRAQAMRDERAVEARAAKGADEMLEVDDALSGRGEGAVGKAVLGVHQRQTVGEKVDGGLDDFAPPRLRLDLEQVG